MAETKDTFLGEIWKPVPGYEGRYEASNLGRLWSIPNGHYMTGRVIKPCLDRTGYPSVCLRHRGERNGATVHLHRVIALTFHGPCPEGMECAHLDGDRTNPAASNLAWVTPAENHHHKKLHGTQTGGFDHPPNKLSPNDVREIRRRYATDESSVSIAADYRLVPETVRMVATGMTYADFEPETICRPRGRGFRWHKERGASVTCPEGVRP